MVCTGYLPRFKKQLDGSTYAGLNCTAASAAMAADYDSCGYRNVSPSTVRGWTGDHYGGTTLAQVDYALQTHLNIDLDTRYRLSWTDFVAKINAGRGAILQGWYAPIRATRFRGSETFGGNHAIFVPPGWKAMDPLCDGRRPGIYEYHKEVYPQSLLKDFAGKLNIGQTGADVYRPLGNGLVYASFTRDNTAQYVATVRPIGGNYRRYYYQYTIANGVIAGRRKTYTRGFQVACTQPKLYAWPGNSGVSLVRVIGGGYNGIYISATFAKQV